jgi:hypothetical protein
MYLRKHIPRKMLNTLEAAAYCGSSASTFAKLRLYGGGPRFVKLGHHLARAKRIKTMKELTINFSKINSQRTRLRDRRPSETFSVECAGQPTRKRASDHAKGKSRVRLNHAVDDAVLLHHQRAVKGVFGVHGPTAVRSDYRDRRYHHRGSVLNFQGP